MEGDVIVGAPPSRAGLPEVLHAEASPTGVRVHGGELEHCSFGSSVRIDFSDEGHQLAKSAVQPGDIYIYIHVYTTPENTSLAMAIVVQTHLPFPCIIIYIMYTMSEVWQIT